MPVPSGRSTKLPFGPPNVWTTPTDGFFVSPTTAIRIVMTLAPDASAVALAVPDAVGRLVFVSASLVHAAVPATSRAATPMSAQRFVRTVRFS